LRNFVSTLLITYNFSLHFVGNKLGEKLTHIQESLLKRHDPALFLRLEKLEIYPQLYGIRQVALFSSFKHFLRGGAEILVTLWLMSDGQHYFKKLVMIPCFSSAWRRWKYIPNFMAYGKLHYFHPLLFTCGGGSRN
jgi:hypothetical protein